MKTLALIFSILLAADAYAQGLSAKTERAGQNRVDTLQAGQIDTLIKDTRSKIKAGTKDIFKLESCLGASQLYTGQCATPASLKGPQGDKGDPGPQGPNGPAGPQGCSPIEPSCGLTQPVQECIAKTQSRKRPCPAPSAAVVTDERSYNCSTNSWNAWAPTNPEICSPGCPPAPDEPAIRDIQCPNGLEGTYQQSRAWQCPAGVWTAWGPASPPANSCIPGCPKQPNEPTKRDASCPTGLTGTFAQTREWQCPQGSWSNWAPSSAPEGACNTSCKPETEARTAACPSGSTGSFQQTRTRECPNGTWSAWAPTSAPSGACTKDCKSEPETRTASCPTGSTGSFQQTRTKECPSGAWTAWEPASAPAGACKAECKPETETRIVAGGDETPFPYNEGGGQWRQAQCQFKQTRTKSCPSGQWSEWSPSTLPPCPKTTWECRSYPRCDSYHKAGDRIELPTGSSPTWGDWIIIAD